MIGLIKVVTSLLNQQIETKDKNDGNDRLQSCLSLKPLKHNENENNGSRLYIEPAERLGNKDDDIVKQPAVLSWKNNGYRFGTGCFIKKG